MSIPNMAIRKGGKNVFAKRYTAVMVKARENN